MAAMGLNLSNPYFQNPFFQNMASLLYGNPPGHPWGPQLSNKTVASMWMNNDAKQLPPPHEEEEVFTFILTNFFVAFSSLLNYSNKYFITYVINSSEISNLWTNTCYMFIHVFFCPKMKLSLAVFKTIVIFVRLMMRKWEWPKRMRTTCPPNWNWAGSIQIRLWKRHPSLPSPRPMSGKFYPFASLIKYFIFAFE